MKTAEVLTSQNVTIQYELASVRDRFLALLLDQVLLWFSVAIVTSIGNLVFPFGFGGLFWIVVLIIAVCCYTLIFEIVMDGQTPGKRVMGIKVIKLNGKEALSADYFLRWVMRLIDIWLCIGSIAAMMVASGHRAQRLGGLLSDTIVIRTRPSIPVSLESVLKLHSKTEEEVWYPAVTRYSEDDMLYAKHVLDLYIKRPNEAHRGVLKELIMRICEDLRVDQKGLSDTKFIRKLIRDYVVLTR